MTDEPNNTIPTEGEQPQVDRTAPAEPPVQAAEPLPDAGVAQPLSDGGVVIAGWSIPAPAPAETPEPIAVAEAPPAPKPAPAPVEPLPKSDKMNWYILKVQSNREDSIREGLQRRVRIAGLDHFFGNVIVPIEKVAEFKGGKKRIVKRKLYPGYLVVQMEINEETWFLVRETPGIGDFTGSSGHPSPMLPHEVERIVARQEGEKGAAPVQPKIKFKSGDRIKINEGTFENFEGEVESVDQSNGRVTVMINIFGRSTPVELEYWQIESV